jgi:hypothetical protein
LGGRNDEDDIVGGCLIKRNCILHDAAGH